MYQFQIYFKVDISVEYRKIYVYVVVQNYLYGIRKKISNVLFLCHKSDEYLLKRMKLHIMYISFFYKGSVANQEFSFRCSKFAMKICVRIINAEALGV